jgi:phage virion morphogenesis protein
MSIQGIEKIFRRVKTLADNAKNPAKPLKVASVYMLGSIQKNFRAQGRPEKWTKLATSTKARRRKGRGRGQSQILIDRGILKNSFSHRLVQDGAEIGTNAVQAKRQHFGYEGGKGRGRSKTPARPFLMYQEEDVRNIAEIFSRHSRS